MLRHPTEGETYRLYRGGGEGGLATTPMTTSGRFTMEGGTTNLAATSSRWNWMCFQVSLVESSAGGFHQWGIVPADLNCVPAKFYTHCPVKGRKEACSVSIVDASVRCSRPMGSDHPFFLFRDPRATSEFRKNNFVHIQSDQVFMKAISF